MNGYDHRIQFARIEISLLIPLICMISVLIKNGILKGNLGLKNTITKTSTQLNNWAMKTKQVKESGDIIKILGMQLVSLKVPGSEGLADGLPFLGVL